MFAILGLLAGALVIVCISINGKLANKVGLIQSGMINFIAGLLSSAIYVYLIKGYQLSAPFKFTNNMPFYYLLGGLIGSLIMVLNNLVINKLSAVYVTILIFIGQLAVGIFIDYLSSGLLSFGKIVGGMIILCGLYCYVKSDIKKCVKS